MHLGLAAVAFLALDLCALGACSRFHPPPERESLVGCWEGEDFQPTIHARASSFIDRQQDGTFKIEFRTAENGRSHYLQTETGQWKYAAGVETVATTAVDGNAVDTNDPQFTDLYEVKSLDDGNLTYYHRRSQITFTSRKVPCSAERFCRVTPSFFCGEFDTLATEVPRSELDKLKSNDPREAATRTHLDLGMHIRNRFGLWSNDSPTARFFRDNGVTHPDFMSYVMTRAFVQYLNAQPLDMKELCRQAIVDTTVTLPPPEPKSKDKSK